MPIEVRELVIKARVEDLPDKDRSGSDARTSSGSSSSLNESELQAIVDMCTEAVLKIIERQKQR